jgi:hypothetical protein
MPVRPSSGMLAGRHGRRGWRRLGGAESMVASDAGGAQIGDELGWGFDHAGINGVDIVPLVEAELNRCYPERTKLDPADADGFREAWAIIERVWPPTVERTKRLPPELLHERVEGEWSFIETLRHLVFATDAWVRRAILGLPALYSPLGLPHDEMEPDPSVPNDPDARPSLDEMLELRADRMRTVHDVIATLTDDVLDGQTDQVPPPGYPPAGS